jgi:hypothetical protein
MSTGIHTATIIRIYPDNSLVPVSEIRTNAYTWCMIKIYIFCMLLLVSVCSFGQADDPGLPGGDPDVPLDGGTGFMLLAGALYGIRKLRGLKEKN